MEHEPIIIICDDPYNEQELSEKEKTSINKWYNEFLISEHKKQSILDNWTRS